MNTPFTLNRRRAKLLGVGAGLADSFGVDPLAVRLTLIAATLVAGPVVVVLYGAAALLAND